MLGLAVIAFGVFPVLVFFRGAFSESISVQVDSVHEFLRHSNPNLEDNMLNASAFNLTIAQEVGNYGPFRLFWFRLYWLLDRGASCHLCNEAHLFVNLKPCHVKISTAKAGDLIVAKGIRDIRLNT